MEFVAYHRRVLDDFLKEFWRFYRQLQAYREQPTSDDTAHLQTAFDTVFSTVTGHQELDRLIVKTQAKLEHLLPVPDFPELPVHNNSAELAARQRVRKREISFGPPTPDGVAAWDTFVQLVFACNDAVPP